MIEHYFIAIIYIGGFMGLLAITEGIFKLCDYISSDRRIRDKPIEDKSLSDSVRQIKIKPLPDYIEMIKNEYADDTEPQNSRYIKIGI